MTQTQGSNALALVGGNRSALAAFSPEKVELIKRTVAQNTSNDELEMFLYLSERYQLDPFLKEIWCIKRQKKNAQGVYENDPNAPALIMTSRDGYLKIAQSNPDFDGLNSFEVREGDDFEYDSVNHTVRHKFGASRGKILGAWAGCYHKKRKPAFVYVPFAEYKQDNAPIWNKFPSAMIRKVAEVIVLKRQFSISGLVTQEELTRDFEAIDGNEYTMQTVSTNASAPRPSNPEAAAEPVQTTASNADLRRQRSQTQSQNTASGNQGAPATAQSRSSTSAPAPEAIDKQKKAILNMAQRKGLSDMDFVVLLDGASGKQSIDELTAEDCAKVIQALNKYKNTSSASDVPASQMTIDLGDGVHISEGDLPF